MENNISFETIAEKFRSLTEKKARLEEELDKVSNELDDTEEVFNAVANIKEILDEFEGSVPTDDFDITIQGQSVDLIVGQRIDGRYEIHFYSGVDDVNSTNFEFEDEPIPTDDELIKVSKILVEYF